MPTSKVDHQRRKRKDGLQWPWHPFQIASWVLYLYLGITAFGFILPILPCAWQSACNGILGILFALHFVFHTLTISTDSSCVDPKEAVSVKEAKETKPKKIHCHIIPVTFYKEKIRFCNICGKDVFNFDHHSRIFNTCLGGRNIWFYYNSIVTAFLGTTCLAIISLFVFSIYCHEPWVKMDSSTSSWLVSSETLAIGILIISFIDSILCFSIAPVLGYYICLHLYLLCHGSTTHEYYEKRDLKRQDLEAAHPCQNFHLFSMPSVPRKSDLSNTAIQTEQTATEIASVTTQTQKKILYLRTIGSQTITEEVATRQSGPSLTNLAEMLLAPFKCVREPSIV